MGQGAIAGMVQPVALACRPVTPMQQPGRLPCSLYAARLFAVLATASLSGPAFALRPFDSTDADVVRQGEVEIEFGLLTLERDEGENTWITPALVFNYGLTDALELVGEFDMEKSPGENWDLTDPGIFLKYMLKDGVMQDAPGLSVATEFGFLFSTDNTDKNDVGGEGILILSNTANNLTYHVNVGGGIDPDGDNFRLWGLVGELPVSTGLTLVGEYSGEKVSGEASEETILLGLLFEPKGSELTWDFGVRRKITRQAADLTLTAGFTLTF